ncbi:MULTISPECIES: Arc family DNA-binding protein [unclassified Embleya]|uniref:Arc family DNA-binding protein n=1 Tax=unclassified Embleya TaxID=2699296 RepID=UPI0034004C44
MELREYVEALRDELVAASAAGDTETRAVAERLVAPLESAVRLTLLKVLSAAVDEISRDLAPGSVDLRLRGMDPSFVVTAPPSDGGPAGDDPAETGDAASDWLTGALGGPRSGATARINFRPPEEMKEQIEKAASSQGISVNTWMVRASAAALTNSRRSQRGKQQFNGWVQ